METVKEDIYIKLDNHVRIEKNDVSLGDMASVCCNDEVLRQQAEGTIIFSFEKEKKEVVSILYIYERLYQELGEKLRFYSIGETDCVVDLTEAKGQSEIWGKVQVVFVSLITFFGAAFSIMTYNEDAGVADVFKKLYQLFLEEGAGNGVLEGAYSIGIAMGVILFFNHFENKKRRDPTAMEIQMNKYEKDVVEASVKASDRRGKSLDSEG